MDKALALFENSLQLKSKFYNFLNSDHIDLERLSTQADTLLMQRNQIRESILELA